jgi:hypothetical protein
VRFSWDAKLLAQGGPTRLRSYPIRIVLATPDRRGRRITLLVRTPVELLAVPPHDALGQLAKAGFAGRVRIEVG